MRETGGTGRRPSPYPRSPQDQSAMAAPAKAAPKRRGGNRRRYIAGVSAAAVVAAVTAGMMSTGSAYAEGGDDTVVFNGHCGLIGLGQASKPDKESVSITEQDRVTFVNNLGTKATLLLGKEKINVPKGGEYTTTLATSSEAVMAPDCLTNLHEQADIVTLTVTETPAEDPGSSNGSDNSTSGDSNRSGDSGTSNGPGNQPGPDGDGIPDDGQAPLDGDDPAASGAVPEPDGDKDAKDETTADDDAETSGTTGDNGSTTAQTDQVEAVDVGTIEETGSSGLLALLATVCLVGVAVAAFRTMMAQRAAARS